MEYETGVHNQGRCIIWNCFFAKLILALVHVYHPTPPSFKQHCVDIANWAVFAKTVSCYFKKKIDVTHNILFGKMFTDRNFNQTAWFWVLIFQFCVQQVEKWWSKKVIALKPERNVTHHWMFEMNEVDIKHRWQE